MSFLMTAGIFGVIGYMGYYTKQETKAIIGDNILKPSGIQSKDKNLIKNNFERICKRCDIKLDKNNNPVYKNHYKPCVAYLQYQGFQEDVAFYFKDLYLERYNNKEEKRKNNIEDKHFQLDILLHDKHNEGEIKVFKYWSSGDTKLRCEKIMKNWLWSSMVKYYNIVNDGQQNVEVWTLYAPPVILNQINTIYEEVCYLEGV